jgi:hypothetical protein
MNEKSADADIEGSFQIHNPWHTVPRRNNIYKVLPPKPRLGRGYQLWPGTSSLINCNDFVRLQSGSFYVIKSDVFFHIVGVNNRCSIPLLLDMYFPIRTSVNYINILIGLQWTRKGEERWTRQISDMFNSKMEDMRVNSRILGWHLHNQSRTASTSAWSPTLRMS